MVLSSEQRYFLVKMINYYKRYKLNGTHDYRVIMEILTVGVYDGNERYLINDVIKWYKHRLVTGYK